jgi:hypothetical protein
MTLVAKFYDLRFCTCHVSLQLEGARESYALLQISGRTSSGTQKDAWLHDCLFTKKYRKNVCTERSFREYFFGAKSTLNPYTPETNTQSEEEHGCEKLCKHLATLSIYVEEFLENPTRNWYEDCVNDKRRELSGERARSIKTSDHRLSCDKVSKENSP